MDKCLKSAVQTRAHQHTGPWAFASWLDQRVGQRDAKPRILLEKLCGEFGGNSVEKQCGRAVILLPYYIDAAMRTYKGGKSKPEKMLCARGNLPPHLHGTAQSLGQSHFPAG